MKLLKILLSVVLIAVLGGCRSHMNVSDHLSYTPFKTSGINTSASGIITVRAWGNASDKRNAIEEAMKNAVSDVIFTGIKGMSGYAGQPIVTEVNARERYAEYFDRFFANGGEYRQFVKEASSTDNSRTRAKSNGRENYGVTLDIDRPALVKRLAEDGIINR